MATEVKLPQWAMLLTDGMVARWNVNVGDQVKAGDVLCDAEAEKVSESIESPVDGTILKICVEEGVTIPVLTTICIIGEPGETIEEAE